MCRWEGLKKHQVQILNLCTFLRMLDEKRSPYLPWVTMATVRCDFIFFNMKLYTSAGEWSCLSWHHMYLGDKDYRQ